MPRKPPKVRMAPPLVKTADFRTVKPQPRTYATRLAQDPGMAFYSTPEWRELRSAVMKERGQRCEDCGRTETRIYLDHVVELRDGGAPLDRANLRLRCGACHTAKTYRARAERFGLA